MIRNNHCFTGPNLTKTGSHCWVIRGVGRGLLPVEFFVLLIIILYFPNEAYSECIFTNKSQSSIDWHYDANEKHLKTTIKKKLCFPNEVYFYK